MAGVKNEPVTLTTESVRLCNVAHRQMIQHQCMLERPIVDEVENPPSDKSSQHLGSPVRQYLAPGMPAGCSQSQRYGRIDMSATYSSGDVDTEHNSETPPKDY